MILFQNNMYKVFFALGGKDYLVINRLTNVVEERTAKLPTAIGMAIGAQEALERLVKSQEKKDESSSSS